MSYTNYHKIYVLTSIVCLLKNEKLASFQENLKISAEKKKIAFFSSLKHVENAKREKNREPHPTFEETYTTKHSFVISFLEFQMSEEIRKT